MAFQALAEVLTALTDIHETLLELAEQKKQVLIHNNVEQLMKIVNQENKLIKKINELDQARIEAIGQIMIEKGYKPNPKVTVSDLTKILFNIEDKKTILGLQKQLLSMIWNLREKNTLNQKLITQALSFIDYSLDVIAGPPEDDLMYRNPKLQTDGNKRTGLFDRRA